MPSSVVVFRSLKVSERKHLLRLVISDHPLRLFKDVTQK